MTDLHREGEPTAQPGTQGPASTASGTGAQGEYDHRQIEDGVQLEELHGELVLWRVFGLSDVFEDRPLPYWTAEEGRGQVGARVLPIESR